MIKVPSGSVYGILNHLSKTHFSILDVKALNSFGMPQQGILGLDHNLSRADFLYQLSKAKSKTVQLTIIPGTTTIIVLAKIAKNFKLDLNQLKFHYYKQSPLEEGFLIPQTYNIPLNFDEQQIINYLIKEALKIHKQRSYYYLGKIDFKRWFKTLTIASIIEKEAANKTEMPLISSVIYNRLARNMRLQMDGSLNYGKYAHQKVTSKRIKNDNSIFNTYKFKGLPKYPVALTSKASLEAALYPLQNDYLYFVKGEHGKHIFSTNYKDHLKAIKK